ncbi:hypothetical protein F8A86_15485 [Betaproteobacteria bacterium SCN1]|nr:hypothetical protein F8A86_15485 [Betaproteobacteria bacterium SCN1]
MEITDVLSIYAALLSTIVFAWNMRKAIPRYKVEIIFGTDKVDGKYVSGAYISVKNPSSHTVHLSNIAILYPFGKQDLLEKVKHIFKYRRLPLSVGWCSSSLSNYGIDDTCPRALEPGKSIGILVPDKILGTIFEDYEVREIKASVQGELWRNKYSRKF